MEREFQIIVEDIPLRGKLFYPPGKGREKVPLIIICHGIPGDKARFSGPPSTYGDMARGLRREGFLTCTFNFRGTGKSGGNFDLEGWKKDLKGVVNLVKTLPRAGRINLLGFSAGAALALHQGVRDREIHSLVLGACPASFDFMVGEDNLEEIIQTLRERGIIRDRDFPPHPQRWLEGALSLKPREEISAFSPRPLLLLHGTRDQVVPLEHAYILYRAAAQPKELKIIKGAGHRLRQYPRVIETALAWIKDKNH